MSALVITAAVVSMVMAYQFLWLIGLFVAGVPATLMGIALLREIWRKPES